MGRSIRSKRGKELRRLQREKLAYWDNNRIQKLSNSLVKSAEHVQYLTPEGEEVPLTEEQRENLVQDLAKKVEEGKESDQMETEEKKEKTLNQIIKGGIPKRKKRNTARYGKHKKKRTYR